MTRIEVVGFGAMNIDHLYRVPRILTDGEATVEEHMMLPGGSSANTVYALAKLGVSTGFVGVVGNDKEGRILLQDFQRVGVDTGQIRVKESPTGSALCLTDKQGRRAIYVSPGANAQLTRQDIDVEYVNRAKLLHLSSFIDNDQLEIQKNLMKQLSPSLEVSFAPGAIYAAKGLDSLAPIIGRADLLFLNRKELKQLTGEDFPMAARRCLEQGCHVVIVTLGRGDLRESKRVVCYIASGSDEYTVEVSQRGNKDQKEGTGAGDAFAAGFIYGFLRGKDLPECGRLGDLVARFCIAQMGARPGLPSLSELSQSYQELYGRLL